MLVIRPGARRIFSKPADGTGSERQYMPQSSRSQSPLPGPGQALESCDVSSRDHELFTQVHGTMTSTCARIRRTSDYASIVSETDQAAILTDARHWTRTNSSVLAG
jgi:hypothetical protein